MSVYLVFVAAFATLVATYVYIRSMFKGGAKPNRVSWLMWSIAPFIATAAAISNGVGWAALPVFMTGCFATSDIYSFVCYKESLLEARIV